MTDKTIILGDDEIKLLKSVINHRQSQVIKEQATQIYTISNISNMDNNKNFKQIFDIWNKETTDEWMILHNIKGKLK
jgi:hypothetical protein